MNRQSGFTMILVVIVGFALMILAGISLQMSKAHSVAQRVEREALTARQIADSAAARALAKIKEGGMTTPVSGGGTTPAWVNFSTGQYYYYTTYDAATNVTTIRAWGRVAADPSPSTCTASPDSTQWDGTGWMLKGIEITVRSIRRIPESPLYFGNGGIEKPLGGFEWSSGADPTNPSTWVPVTSSPSSYQASWVPFQASALDYPADYIYSGGTPSPASSCPHPYAIWAAQNQIGQYNIKAWFTKSAGAGVDPTVNVTPPPTSTYYDTSDQNSPDYPYPVVPDLPDVQSFSCELWNKYKGDPSANRFGSGTRAGEYGTLSAPSVTFVTGSLSVAAGTTFRGCGILVIRDDYDPNTQTYNTPSIRAGLAVSGTFQWTGLVIVAGWCPDINVSSTAGANATIVGALFGEDSVQSGGEISLDSATISIVVNNPFRILYSNALFQPGGMVYNFMPFIDKRVVGIREL